MLVLSTIIYYISSKKTEYSKKKLTFSRYFIIYNFDLFYFMFINRPYFVQILSVSLTISEAKTSDSPNKTFFIPGHSTPHRMAPPPKTKHRKVLFFCPDHLFYIKAKNPGTLCIPGHFYLMIFFSTIFTNSKLLRVLENILMH